MCVGNRAEVSVRYINHQLFSHWENAKICASDVHSKLSHHSHVSSAAEESLIHGTMLYQFCVVGSSPVVPSSPIFDPADELQRRQNAIFFARLNAPKIDFICNHEAILYLEVEEAGSVVPKEDRGGMK